MPPSRRSRRSNNNHVPQAPAETAAIYKKGDIVEFELNGSTVAGRLVKKSPRTSSPSGPQLWIVAPSDRRRKNENISELELRRVVDDEDNTNDGGIKRKNSFKSGSSQGSKGSDDNNGRTKTSSSSIGSDSNVFNRRKSEEISDNNSGNSGKKVTFQDQKKKKSPSNGIRVGTRSTRNSNQEFFEDNQQPVKLRKTTVKKIKKNENVTVVQMLTGTLYLYKGERRRAEFIRSKY